MRSHANLGLGPLARCQSDALRQGRELRKQMRLLQQARGQHGSSVYVLYSRYGRWQTMRNITLDKTVAFKTALAGLFLVFFFSGCSSGEPHTTTLFNQAAQLPGQLPFNPLQWQPITSLVDSGASTMSTLYGNDVAVKYARTHAEHSYPDGAILALVTWSQREDPRWHGAYMPGQIQFLEFVYAHATAGQPSSYSYEIYFGSPLVKESETSSTTRNQRAEFLVSLRAAVLP